MKLKEQFSDLMIMEGAKQDLQKLLNGDKELAKQKKEIDFLDKFWSKYESNIDKIQKKYNLGMDELGGLLMQLK